MKKLLTFIFLTALTAALLSSCQEKEIESEEEARYEVYFTRSTYKPTETNLILYLDGQSIGYLPFRSGRMACENDTLKRDALHLPLAPGKYTLEAKDQAGNVRNSSILKITANSLGSGGTAGTTKVIRQDNCLLVELDY